MSDKIAKQLDVKLHNFMIGQVEINRFNKRVIDEMANYINNHWYSNKNDKDVCVEAIK